MYLETGVRVSTLDGLTGPYFARSMGFGESVGVDPGSNSIIHQRYPTSFYLSDIFTRPGH